MKTKIFQLGILTINLLKIIVHDVFRVRNILF